MSQKSKFEHDCDTCILLGVFNDHDLYFHEGEAGPHFTTVIARFTSEGADYASGLPIARQYSLKELEAIGDCGDLMPLRVAYLIAVDRGLVEK